MYKLIIQSHGGSEESPSTAVTCIKFEVYEAAMAAAKMLDQVDYIKVNGFVDHNKLQAFPPGTMFYPEKKR